MMRIWNNPFQIQAMVNFNGSPSLNIDITDALFSKESLH